MFTYSYEGPVYRFESIYTSKWRGYTSAPTERKALANLTYKAKRELRFAKDAKITLNPKYLKLETPAKKEA